MAITPQQIGDIVRAALHPVVRQLAHLAGEYAAIEADTSLSPLEKHARRAHAQAAIEALGILHCDVATMELMRLLNTSEPDRTPDRPTDRKQERHHGATRHQR